MSEVMIECSLNRRGKGGQPSIAEIAWSSGSVEEALSIYPASATREVLRKIRRLLQPWPEGRYTDAYQRSGGILNVLTPPWGEEQDVVWQQMFADWKMTDFPDDVARQEALSTLEQEWNTTPHPYFAGLTPAQVMVGGGSQEEELAEEFLRELTKLYDGRPFESEGQALMKSLMILRAWQTEPRNDGRKIPEIIKAERDELLARRAQSLKENEK
jgi:hypothetical protein